MRTKTRLTITLDQDLLQQVDQLVDGTGIKNRSHAIETLVQQSLEPTVQTALILAGGELTGKNNPGLLKIGNSTLLAHTLEMLKKNGVTTVILAIAANDRVLPKTFGKGENFGLKIEYSREEKPLGTGGAVKKARELIGSRPFVVLHGDVLTTINLTDLCRFHFQEEVPATIAVKPRLSEPHYGQAFIQGNKIVRFLEKGADSGISIINTGVYVFDPKIFELFPQKNRFTLEKEVFPLLAERQQLSAFFFQGIWYEISTPSQYQEAQQRWKAAAEQSA